MANAWRILGSGAHAVNRSLHRASGGRVLGKLGGMPVLLMTVAGRKTAICTPIRCCIWRTRTPMW
jgi:hypothetical protein